MNHRIGNKMADVSPDITGLFTHCHNATKGDDFVGIKVTSSDFEVVFPIGYKIPDKDVEIRRDIRRLVYILGQYTEKNERNLPAKAVGVRVAVGFPLTAYMNVIEYFYSIGGNYYIERETNYKLSIKGRQDWSRTLKRILPLVQGDNELPSFIYTNFIVREKTPNDNSLITEINRYCVYEAFKIIGWMYSDYHPADIQTTRSKELWPNAIIKRLTSTNDDQKQRLFQSMLDILRYEGQVPHYNELYYGTLSFENVWERMIDSMFGTEDRREYQPKTMWVLDDGNKKVNMSLRPDSIMYYSNEYYILDAKYYQYGVTGSVNDLPSTESITKQILYGEHIELKLGYDPNKIHNIFIMPGDLDANVHDRHLPKERRGEAYCIWRGRDKCYNMIVGVVIDIRYVMYNCNKRDERIMAELAGLCKFSIN